MIAVYRYADRRQGRALMVKLINLISNGVPKLLTEIITLGRTLKNQSETSPTTSPDHRSKLTNSDLNCTLNCEELGTRLSQLDGMVR